MQNLIREASLRQQELRQAADRQHKSSFLHNIIRRSEKPEQRAATQPTIVATETSGR